MKTPNKVVLESNTIFQEVEVEVEKPIELSNIVDLKPKSKKQAAKKKPKKQAETQENIENIDESNIPMKEPPPKKTRKKASPKPKK